MSPDSIPRFAESPSARSVKAIKLLASATDGAALIDIVRDKSYDNSENFQILTEDIVNSRRTHARNVSAFLSHQPRPHEQSQRARTSQKPVQRREKRPHSRSPENLECSASIHGADRRDDTLSYGVSAASGGFKVVAIPKTWTMTFRHRLLHRLQHAASRAPFSYKRLRNFRRLARTLPRAGSFWPLRRLHRYASHYGRRPLIAA